MVSGRNWVQGRRALVSGPQEDAQHRTLIGEASNSACPSKPVWKRFQRSVLHVAGGPCGLLVLGAQRLVRVEAGLYFSRRDSDLHTLGVDAGQVDCVIREFRATVNIVSSGRG